MGLSADHRTSKCPLYTVVVERDPAVHDKMGKPVPALHHVLNRLAKTRLAKAALLKCPRANPDLLTYPS